MRFASITGKMNHAIRVLKSGKAAELRNERKMQTLLLHFRRKTIAQSRTGDR